MYCPECGIKCVTVSNKYNACYDCAQCEVHWLYQDGAYILIEPKHECTNCQVLG